MSGTEAIDSHVLLGWRERVGLPDLGIRTLRAKIDTGARSCALHVDTQWRFTQDGAPWVGFVITARRRPERRYEASALIHDERAVSDSSGRKRERVFIRTRLRLAGIERLVEINLTDRRDMLFPLLVGRTALQGAFIIDPARSFLRPATPRIRDPS